MFLKVLPLMVPFLLFAQLVEAQPAQLKPAYCDGLPQAYDAPGFKPAAKPPLPRFTTRAVTEYKVQVALLRDSDPRQFPFHSKLVARFRPCEQVWVIESRDTFSHRSQAEQLKSELQRLGYADCFITTIIGYQ